MTRVLAFCFFPAFVPPSNGGVSRLFNFYRALSASFEVTLLTSTDPGVQEEVIHHGAGFVERRIPKDHFFTRQWAVLEPFSGGGDLSGPCIAACGTLPTRLHQAYLEEYAKADVVIHDFPFTVQYDLFAGLDDKLRVYNAHNCETLLYRQLHDADRAGPIHEVVRQAELRMLECADLLLYCSEEDLAALRGLAPGARFDAVHVPHGMTPLAQADTASSGGGAFRAVFVGSGHPPNRQAAEFIAHEVAPQLPEVSFDIVGGCLAEGRYGANVRRHGVVGDAARDRLLDAAQLALNPMQSGGGSNVKVLDYLARALPVLSTPFGMRGIDAEAGRQYLEAPLEGFAQAIRRAAADPDSLGRIGSAGWAMAMARYTWDAIGRTAAEAIAGAAKAKAAAGARRHVLALNDYDSFAACGGGGVRTRGLYAAVRRWSPVVFVSFSAEGKLQARRVAEGITVVNVPMTPDHLAERDRVNSLFHVSSDDIVASRHCLDNPYLDAVYRVLRQSARCIVVEHCYLAGLPVAWGDRFVYSSQNSEAELKRRLLEGHPAKAELLAQVERGERLAVECSAATIAVSHDDAESLVRGKRTAGAVVVVRNGAETPPADDAVRQARQRLPGAIGSRSAVFVGSAHIPNAQAAQCIAEQIAVQCPDVEFHLIGSVCDTLRSVPGNLRLWGLVDDATKAAVMQSCALAINPMLSGSGSNVKLADYLANGLFAVCTDFGRRGYPDSVGEHVDVATIEGFAQAIRSALERPALFAEEARGERRALFERELAMEALGERLVQTLRGLETRKKRVLYVAYRYQAPALGGAEVNIERFVAALGCSGMFDVDVVAPEVSQIRNQMRFSERYSFDPQCSALIDVPNVRFARFAADIPAPARIDRLLRDAWRAQPRFERAVSRRLSYDGRASGLAWGWDYPQGEAGRASRWGFTECAVLLSDAAPVRLVGYSPRQAVVAARGADGAMVGSWTIEGGFELDFRAPAGEVEIGTSAPAHADDPRPLAFQLSSMSVGGEAIDLAAPTLLQRQLADLAASASFELLDEAAEETRAARGLRLTDGRGPWSTGLERFIADHVADYDLVVTHNHVFRPAVIAIEEATKRGVPAILVPHAHFDDDFYHFPDLLDSARRAGLVLAAPRVAVDFLAGKGCNARYLPAGCDAQERFSAADVASFREIYRDDAPFVLVLGRKAGAKGYRKIIDAARLLDQEGVRVRVVLIGPDDDGLAVDARHARYLGRQPRNVVRGALMSCAALCNMSSSESFGIVLLEAWLAGRPVIANRNCAAFRDMAVHEENALMVDDSELGSAIRTVLARPELAERLARNGRATAERFDWAVVCAEFVAACDELAGRADRMGTCGSAS